MQGQANNNSHQIPPFFELGNSCDALGDYDTPKVRVAPVLNSRDATIKPHRILGFGFAANLHRARFVLEGRASQNSLTMFALRAPEAVEG